MAKHEPNHKITVLVGQQFYSRVKGAYALIATTERRLYGNIVLRKGVIHPN
jgi:L-fucose mutarotase